MQAHYRRAVFANVKEFDVESLIIYEARGHFRKREDLAEYSHVGLAHRRLVGAIQQLLVERLVRV
jgi:hypothetical protein